MSILIAVFSPYCFLEVVHGELTAGDQDEIRATKINGGGEASFFLIRL